MKIIPAVLCVVLFCTRTFGDFTIAFLPDTQYMLIPSNGQQPEMFPGQTRWLVSQKDILNIVYVGHLGDVVDDGSRMDWWAMGSDAMQILEDGGISYGIAPGNHDLNDWMNGGNGNTNWAGYNATFPRNRIARNTGFQDGFPAGTAVSSYFFFTADGMDFIILNLQYGIPSNTWNWADGVLAANPERRAIINTHDVNSGNVLGLAKKHPNVVLVVHGHDCIREVYTEETNDGGGTFYSILTDYQVDGSGGWSGCTGGNSGVASAYLRYYTFRPAQNRIDAFTYSDWLKKYETDASSQFTMAYEMVPPATPRITAITRSPASPAPEEAVIVSAVITDDVSIASAVLKWGTEPGNLTNEAAMTASGEDFSGEIPGQPVGTSLFYALEATDGDGNTESSEEFHYRVELFITAWNSWDITMESGSPQASVTDGETPADIEFYESANDGGFTSSSMFTAFSGAAHPEGFNNLSAYWAGSGNYPYAGKNATARGAGEPAPNGALDLQIHPPDNGHLTVCAFIVPKAGNYKVSGLGIRRVDPHSGRVSVNLAGADGSLVASMSAGSQSWSLDNDVYDLGAMTAGEKIYFGVGNVDGFSYDAAEISWSVSLFGADDNAVPKMVSIRKPGFMHHRPGERKVYFQRPADIKSISITRMNGKPVSGIHELSGHDLDLSRYGSGVLFLRVESTDGGWSVHKVACL